MSRTVHTVERRHRHWHGVARAMRGEYLAQKHAPDPEAAEYDGPEHACEPCRCDDPGCHCWREPLGMLPCCGAPTCEYHSDEAARANLTTEAYVSGLRRSLDALPELLARWDDLDDDLRNHYEDEIAWMARTLRGWVARAQTEGRPDLAREIVLLSDRWRELGDATDAAMGWPAVGLASPAWCGPEWVLARQGPQPLGATLGMIARVGESIAPSSS